MKKFATVLSLILFLTASVTLTACKVSKADTHYEIQVTLNGNVLTGIETVTYVNDTETFLVTRLEKTLNIAPLARNTFRSLILTA